MKTLLFPLSLFAASLAVHAEEPAAFKLEDVVVKGSRATETGQRQQANVAKIIIPREELEKSGDLSVSDYLKKLPGLGPAGNKGRNIAGGAPQILIDGVAVSGRGRGAQLSRLSLDMIERIEVTRSPTAALSNESAGAVVNIVLKNIVRQALKAGLNLGVGENASRLGGLLSGQIGGRQDDFSWLIVGSYYQRGNLSSTDSQTRSFDTAGAPTAWTRETADRDGVSRNLNLTPKFTWQLNATDRLLVEPSISHSRNPFDNDREQFAYADFVNGAGLASTGSITEDGDDTQTNLNLRGEWQRKQGQAERTLRAGVQRGFGRNDKITRNFDTAGTQTGSRAEEGTSHDWGADLSAQIKQPLAPQHLLTSGVEYAWRKLDEDKDLAIDGVPVAGGAANSFNIGEHSWVAYVQDEWAMNDSMSLTPGLRFRHIERDSEDGAGVAAGARSSTFSPSLHYLWKADERLNFRASASHILKPPAFSDLTTVIGTRDGTQTRPDQSGNPDLKNETAWVYNLGLEHFLADKAGVLGITFFYRDLSDLIQRRTQLEGSRYISRPLNIGNAAIWGVELDGRAKMAVIGLPQLTLRGNFVTQNSRARDDATGETGRVGDLPAYSANLGADYEFAEQKLNLSVNLRLAGKQRMGVGDPESLRPQQFLGINASKKLSKSLTLRMGGYNLLNEKTGRTVNSYHPSPDEDQIASRQQSVETSTRTFYVSMESVW